MISLSRFLRDEKGSHALLMGALLVPMIGFASLAIDSTQSYMAEGELRAGADAAALAGASVFASADRQTVARTVFLESLDDDIQIVDLSIVFDDESGRVDIAVHARTANTLQGVFGNDTNDILVRASAATALEEPYLDLVMCIDATGSMWDTLDAAKQNALNLEQSLLTKLEEAGLDIKSMRARAIYYRDFDPPDLPFPISGSRFFALPEERFSLQAFIDPQIATGGADWPEAGLECFHEAMHSDWIEAPNNRAVIIPVIAVWTDAPADMPDDVENRAQGGVLYPSDMPNSYPGLFSNWLDPNVIPQDLKTLALFGPETGGWWGLTTFPGYVHGGGVTEANASFIDTLADAIVERLGQTPARLVN